MSAPDANTEVLELLELLLEERISPEQFQRLEQLVRADRDARRTYLRYLDLHGSLHWNAALGGAKSVGEKPARMQDSTGEFDEPERFTSRELSRRTWMSSLSVLVTVFLVAFVWSMFRGAEHSEVAQQESQPVNQSIVGEEPRKPASNLAQSNQSHGPVALDLHANEINAEGHSTEPTEIRSVAINTATSNATTNTDAPSKAGSHESLVAFVNDELHRVWEDNEQQPAQVADDGEWLRRAYLDVVGHIPTAKQVKDFASDKRPNKRELVIDDLLDHEDYVRNWTTIWTNLLIGRTNPRQVNRPSMQRFLREAFARNRAWDQVVSDIVAAEGNTEENGAANFLVAHLNNQAVPATAITAKLFLCQQVQCTQCHDHPFNDLKQDSFWSFNSFFKDIKVVDRPKAGNPKVRETVLVHNQHPGAIYYELRNGLLKAAYPRYDGEPVSTDSVDLRGELAKLMRQGESPQLARAFVNRMWQHFFGAAFTSQVDDMGPHARISHPAILDRLTREFVSSGYDVKQLIRWIARTDAYQLTSRFGTGEYRDDPSLGFEPLFSRMYVKRMSVEQAFDSLLIATDARQTFGSNWDEVEQRRQKWLDQFVRSFETDENDEADLFDGTIPQALMMMNGELIQQALKPSKGTYIDQVIRSKTTDDTKIEAIAVAALSRKPTPAEISAVRSLIRENAAHRSASVDRGTPLSMALQDLFWAYLNSNEFILIH